MVTPLIALMKDQVDRLRKLGIRALAIHSGLSARQIDIDLDNCVYGDVKFLYVAPERLASEAFRLRVQRMNVSLLAVDEAHCISQWGYDFRPSYLRIAELRERIPGVPVLALTASATPRVADDIMEKLRFAEPHLLRSDFSRPNLSYAVRHTDDKTNSSCGSSATSAVPASSMSAPAKEPNRSRLSCATKVSPQNIITAGWDTPSARCGRKPGFRGVPRHGRYQCLRDGDRQARRPLRGTLYDVRLARKLLSGGRTCRTRRAAQLCRIADFFRRCGTHRQTPEADYPPLEKIRSIYEKSAATSRSPSATERKVPFYSTCAISAPGNTSIRVWYRTP